MINFNSTVKGSLLENFYPEEWDFQKIDECCSHKPEEIFERQDFWHEDFKPIPCEDVSDFNMMMGHEIAQTIRKTREEKRKLIMIFPVGPMGMYRWAVYFLKEWNVSCSHVYGFNMDEWADGEGNTLDNSDPAAFQNAMEEAFYGPLGELTVPKEQRNFATKTNLPLYPEKIARLKEEGARMVWNWKNVPCCFLGAAFRKRVFQYRRVEKMSLQIRSKVASAYHRTECPYQL